MASQIVDKSLQVSTVSLDEQKRHPMLQRTKTREAWVLTLACFVQTNELAALTSWERHDDIRSGDSWWTGR